MFGYVQEKIWKISVILYPQPDYLKLKWNFIYSCPIIHTFILLCTDYIPTSGNAT